MSLSLSPLSLSLSVSLSLSLSHPFIQHVNSVDPHGPYQIAGYSFGALLAYEMACQLTAAYPDQPDIVKSLILLDGSHRYVYLQTDVYRQSMRLSCQADDEAAALLAFVKNFVKVDDLTVS